MLHGRENSRVLVQERYESLRSTYALQAYDFDTYIASNIPDIDSPRFLPIQMILQTATVLLYNDNLANSEVFETGKLKYGNANPSSPAFDSLADYICSGDYIELKLPWQLLNFSDPSRMMIHDDYYSGNYGIDYIKINELYFALTDGNSGGRIPFSSFKLKGWGNQISYHERLKSSYYMLQQLWS